MGPPPTKMPSPVLVTAAAAFVFGAMYLLDSLDQTTALTAVAAAAVCSAIAQDMSNDIAKRKAETLPGGPVRKSE